MGDAPRSLVLYDEWCKILWVSFTMPGLEPREVVGTSPWEWVTEADKQPVQAAFLLCMADRTPQTFDADVSGFGRWRTDLHFVGMRKVRLAAFSRQFPPEIPLLTEREREVCRLLADGLSSKLIAKQLDLSRSTVDNHRAHIAHKIDVHSSALVSWCGHLAEWF